MDFLRAHRWVGFLLIILGGVLIAGSCFDRGVTDLDDTRVLTKVCSDYPAGTAPADCVTSREVLDENNAVDSWPLFIVGLLLLGGGLALVTGVGPFKRETVVAAPYPTDDPKHPRYPPDPPASRR